MLHTQTCFHPLSVTLVVLDRSKLVQVYSGEYPRESRGIPGFNSPTGSLTFWRFCFFFSTGMYATTIIHVLVVLVVLFVFIRVVKTGKKEALYRDKASNVRMLKNAAETLHPGGNAS